MQTSLDALPDPKRLESVHYQVLRHIEGCGFKGATTWECEVALGLNTKTASSAVNWLANLGFCFYTRRHRPTDTGEGAGVVIALTPRVMDVSKVDLYKIYYRPTELPKNLRKKAATTKQKFRHELREAFLEKFPEFAPGH